MKGIIEAGGGVLRSKPPPGAEKEHSIKLVSPGDLILNHNTDHFNYNYILDCQKHDQLLNNLRDYILGESAFEDYDALRVLLGEIKWSDIKRREIIGEKLSFLDDKDDDDEYDNSKKSNMKYAKAPYTRKEDEEIVEWIVKNQAYKDLKGNKVWEEMEVDEVGRGRTYQSLKERFKKKIITQIHTFSLSEDVVSNFKVAMGHLQDDIVGARIMIMKRPVLKTSRTGSMSTHVDDLEDFADEKAGPSKQNKKNPALDRVESVDRVENSVEEERSKLVIDTEIETEEEAFDTHDELDTEDSSDPDLYCHICEGDKASKSPLKLKKICTDCVRPSRSNYEVIKSPGHRSHKSSSTKSRSSLIKDGHLERLLDMSNLEDQSDTDEGSDATERQDTNNDKVEPEPVAGPSRAMPKKNRRERPVRVLYDPDKVMETPASNPRSRKVKTYKIESVPPSNLEFGIGLKEASKAKTSSQSEDDEEDSALTSTQFIGEHEAAVSSKQTQPSSSPRGEKSKRAVKRKLSRRSHFEVSSEDEQLNREHTQNQSISKSIINRSVNLLERHLEDQQQLQAMKKRKVGTQDLVNALNDMNETDEENNDVDNDDEIVFGEPRSPTSDPMSYVKTQMNDEQWETSTFKSGRFFNEGYFSHKFRVPYTFNEEKAIVEFFVKQGGFRLRSGVSVWKSMEAQKVCEHRTWHSMKARWQKFISTNLAKFNVTEDQLVKIDQKIFGDHEDEEDVEGNVDNTRSRTPKKSQRPSHGNMYTRDEDKKIIRYILENNRYQDVKGRALWELMAERNELPGRTWQSLKERFLKVIRKNVRNNPKQYGLNETEVKKILYFE